MQQELMLLAFHATCARKEHLFDANEGNDWSTEPPTLQCFCERHIPVTDLVHVTLCSVCFDTILNQREQAEARIIALEAEEQENQGSACEPKVLKTCQGVCQNIQTRTSSRPSHDS